MSTGSTVLTALPVALLDDLRAAVGADHVLAVPFDRTVASWSPEEFIERVLVDSLHAAAVVVGASDVVRGLPDVARDGGTPADAAEHDDEQARRGADAAAGAA